MYKIKNLFFHFVGFLKTLLKCEICMYISRLTPISILNGAIAMFLALSVNIKYGVPP